MTFSTGIFALFLGLALFTYWAAPPRWRRYVMIGSGVVFYGYYLPKYLLLIGGMVVITYVFARVIIDRQQQGGPAAVAKTGDDARGGSSARRVRRWFTAGILVILLVLGFFKYWKMAVDTVNGLLAWLDWGVAIPIPIPHILVPLGISYITFELIHYLSDVYTGKIKPATVNAVDLALFTFFFPTMVSGPIKRYQQFQEQTAARLPFDREMFFYGAYRVVLGLGKKFIIADTVGRLTTVLSSPETAAPGMVLLGVYAYAIKIYFDFAGYSDMAIGIGRMFGYRVPENFDRPYLQPNIAAFWRRWHMSLSSWIRDYIYIPLGGSRRGLPRTLANLVVAFTLCGLWHGAAWNFVVWGAWHGLGLAAYRLWRHAVGSLSGTGIPGAHKSVVNAETDNGFVQGELAAASDSPGPGIKQLMARAAGIFITFHFVTAGWVLFAAPDLPTAAEIFYRCLALL